MAPEEVDTDCGSQDGSRWADANFRNGTKLQPNHASQRRGRPEDSLHARVPRTVNLAEEHARNDAGRTTTTVMIRNIPNRFSQTHMVERLGELGFKDTFDFLYIPLDLGTMSNVGYAFVNFTDAIWAAKCMHELPGSQLTRKRGGGKVIATSTAYLQGLEANLQHYDKSAVKSARLRQRRPVVLSGFPRDPDIEAIRRYGQQL